MATGKIKSARQRYVEETYEKAVALSINAGRRANEVSRECHEIDSNALNTISDEFWNVLAAIYKIAWDTREIVHQEFFLWAIEEKSGMGIPENFRRTLGGICIWFAISNRGPVDVTWAWFLATLIDHALFEKIPPYNFRSMSEVR